MAVSNLSFSFRFTTKPSLVPPLLLLHLLLLIIYQTSRVNSSVNSPSEIQEAPKIQKHVDGLLRIEQQLARARREIHKSILSQNFTYSKKWNFIPQGSIYKNPYAFHRSHIEMMKNFKVWVYKEGDIPLVHTGPTRNLYAMEGIFINELERPGNPMLASHPSEAHAFFIPISLTFIVKLLYQEFTKQIVYHLQDIVEDYIEVISNKYPYWNRSNGADHFLVSCHDFGPFVSRRKPKLFKNFIRVLCNANSSEGFIPSRDVSMTEVFGPVDYVPRVTKGESPTNRPILAFFAGGNHGYVRNILFRHWGNHEDNDIKLYDYLPKGLNYTKLMTQSKFCLCPSGYEVASPRATEAILAGCVPVMISDHYVLPYSDVLNWSQFSVQVSLDRIPHLRKILEEISFDQYLKMQKRVIRVQKHFRINARVEPFDVFHMVLHSVWLRRLNVRLPILSR